MIECIKFKSFNKGYLQGFADLYFEIDAVKGKVGLEFIGIPMYMKDGKRWISFPSKEYVNAEGEKKFMPYYRFRDKGHYTAFCDMAKEAIDKWCLENQKTQHSQNTPSQENFDDSSCLF